MNEWIEWMNREFYTTFVHNILDPRDQIKLIQENIMGTVRSHCHPEIGIEMVVWGWARYISVTETLRSYLQSERGIDITKIKFVWNLHIGNKSFFICIPDKVRKQWDFLVSPTVWQDNSKL